MVDETRAVQLDLAARAPFAADGERITETRGVIADLFDPAGPDTSERVIHTATSLAAAEAGGFVEVG